MRQFFAMNGNLFVRSACMLVIYTGFTSIAANYGNTLLAVSSVMMKLLLLYSYLVDGFAYAGEALTGRFIGENDSYSLHHVIKKLFIWGIGIGILSTIIYAFAGEPLIRLFTDNVEVIEASQPFLFWLLLMPVVSCAAFTWDGIYIGATASRALRNGMILSSVFFVLSYLALKGVMGIQALYVAYFVHLIIRTIFMSIMAKKEIYGLLD